MDIKSVLLLDDEQGALDLIQHLLGLHLQARLVTTRFPTHAIQLARDHCFDLILLDVTVNYNGTQFGGLEVYKSLLDRYGNSSLLAYSQYITDELLQRYGLPFNFIEKDTNVMQWATKLVEEFGRLRKRQTCFVAMPFGDDYAVLFDTLRSCIEVAGYRCVRVDQQVFTESIVERIFDEIRKAKIVIFVATARNPNVFYEAGYAVALGKEVVTITDEYRQLPFDIRDRNAVAYGSDPKSVRDPLEAKLASLTFVE